MSAEPDWEDVASPTQGDYLERIAVPGGWLYRTMIDHNLRADGLTSGKFYRTVSVALVFVPRPDWMP